MRTPLVQAQVTALAAHRGITEEAALHDVLLEPQALKELIEPEEVANVVAFLLGDGGRAFSGVPITMDLGWTAR